MSFNRFYNDNEIDHFKQFEKPPKDRRDGSFDESIPRSSDLRDFLQHRKKSQQSPEIENVRFTPDRHSRSIENSSRKRPYYRSRSRSPNYKSAWSTVSRNHRQSVSPPPRNSRSRSPGLLNLKKLEPKQRYLDRKRSPVHPSSRNGHSHNNDFFYSKSRESISPDRYHKRSITPVNPLKLKTSNADFPLSASSPGVDGCSVDLFAFKSNSPTSFMIEPIKNETPFRTDEFLPNFNSSSYNYSHQAHDKMSSLSARAAMTTTVVRQDETGHQNMFIPSEIPVPAIHTCSSTINVDSSGISHQQQNSNVQPMNDEDIEQTIANEKESVFKQLKDVLNDRCEKILKLFENQSTLFGRFFMNKYSKVMNTSNNIIIEGNCFQSPIKKNIGTRLPFTYASEEQKSFENRMFLTKQKKILRILNIEDQKKIVQKTPGSKAEDGVSMKPAFNAEIVENLQKPLSSLASFCQKCRRDMSEKMFFDVGTQTDINDDRARSRSYSPTTAFDSFDVRKSSQPPKSILKNSSFSSSSSFSYKNSEEKSSSARDFRNSKNVLNIEEYKSRRPLKMGDSSTLAPPPPTMSFKMSTRGAHATSMYGQKHF